MKQVMKSMHLFSFTKEEEEEDLLFGMLNIFIVKNMITPLNFAGRKLKRRRGESSFMHEGEKKSEDDALFLACNVEKITHDEVWYIDSVYSNHMTGNKKMFVNLDEFITSEVRIGNDKRLSVKIKGDILLQTKKGEKHISNVSMFPDSSIIFLVSASFYFEDFMFMSTKICARSRTSTMPLLQK